MNAKGAPELIGDSKLPSRSGHLKENFPIQKHFILNIQTTHSIENTLSKKRRRLNNDRPAINTSIHRHLIGIQPPQKPVAGVNQITVSADNVHVLMLFKKFNRGSYSSRPQQIIGVQESEYLSCCLGKPIVQSIRSSTIRAQNYFRYS